MFKNNYIRKRLLGAIVSIGLFTLIGFVEKKHSDKTVAGIVINIDCSHENFFLDKEDVITLLTGNNTELLLNEKWEDINLKKLELRLKNYKFVEDAQIYKDHNGKLIVDIRQSRPIARVIQSDGPHAYIGEQGKILPTSEKFTSRVLLIDGAFAKTIINQKFLSTEQGQEYLQLLNLIDKDDFWRAQIAQLSINEKGNILMHPQIGKQIIEFGTAENAESKLKKLKICYKEILPYKGWNRYHKINLMYKDQIICE